MPRFWFLISISKKSNQPGETADSRAGAGNIQNEPIASYSAREYGGALKTSKKKRIHVNRTQEPTESVPNDQG